MTQRKYDYKFTWTQPYTQWFGTVPQDFGPSKSEEEILDNIDESVMDMHYYPDVSALLNNIFKY